MSNHGFRECSRRHSDILDADLIQFEHEKTGARLAVILNDDENKVFQIGFRTPSDNSTGVAHIMEHSTLCGSRKYPVKEPFVELAKGSINTFLNAMTYPDKTVYPIASTNDKDFRNLQDVYLDAVFYPNIYENPYTLMQEGWHYHLENEEDPITYSGVVYNEMKGVFSNPEEILDRKTYELLFPDNIYAQESGGDPDVIPELTYEDFLNFHRKFYHPSNSWIYLYGDLDLDEQLEYLDSWLDDYDREEVDSEIALQAPFEELKEATYYYPVTEESDEDRDYLSLNWVLPAHASLKDNLENQILSYALLSTNASPLKKALLQSGLAKDISYSLSTPLLQPVLTIELKNTDHTKAEEFKKVVRETLEQIQKEGFKEEDLTGAININEFKTLEVLGGETGMNPKGLLLGLELMESWLYGDDAFDRLNYEGVFNEIREDAKNGVFEELIGKLILDNPHVGLVSLLPKAGLAEERDQKLTEKLKAYKDSLSEEELKALVEQTNTLQERQKTEDSEEALRTIPRLEVSEISREAVSPDWTEKKIDGITFLEHEEATKGIVYLDLFFDAEYVPSEDIHTLSLINKMFGRLGTTNLSFEDLIKQVDLYTGGISSSFDTNEDADRNVVANFSIHAKSTLANVPEMLRLLGEMLLNAEFEETEQIRNLVSEGKLLKEQTIQSSGHAIAAQRISATCSDSARLFEEVGGIGFYDWICDLDKNFDNKIDELKQDSIRVMREVINRNGLCVSITAEKDDMEKVQEEVLNFVRSIPEAVTEKKAHHFDAIPENEAFATAGQILFNVQGGTFRDIEDYSGSMLVAKTLLSMDYLWNTVRVQGGAYGAGFGMNRSGDLVVHSYRDPHLEKTYDVYQGIPEYLENLDLSQDELEKYIIGTISPKEVPLSPYMRASLANTMYLTGLSAQDRQKEREEILDVTNEDLRALGPVVRKVLDQNKVCTVGSMIEIDHDQEKNHRFNGVRNIG